MIHDQSYPAVVSEVGNTVYHIPRCKYPLFSRKAKPQSVTLDQDSEEVQHTIWMMRTDNPIVGKSLLTYLDWIKEVRKHVPGEECDLHFPLIELKKYEDIKDLINAKTESEVFSQRAKPVVGKKCYELDGPMIVCIESTMEGKPLNSPLFLAYFDLQDFRKPYKK